MLPVVLDSAIHMPYTITILVFKINCEYTDMYDVWLITLLILL